MAHRSVTLGVDERSRRPSDAQVPVGPGREGEGRVLPMRRPGVPGEAGWVGVGVGAARSGTARYLACRPRRLAIHTSGDITARTSPGATAGSSAREYYEDAKSGAGYREVPNETPTGVSVYPYDFRSVRVFAERSNNIVHWSQVDRGGHFAASDAPDLLVEDLRTSFRRFR